MAEEATPTEKPTESPREKLFRTHKELSALALALMKKKNSDYATESDPLFNFRRHGEYGIVVRMDDKLCRLQQIIKKGKWEVEDEPPEETLKDIMNYCVILSYMIREH